MRRINPAAPIAALVLLNTILYLNINRQTQINPENNHFRCDNATPQTLIKDNESCTYVGHSFVYNGLNSSKEMFYLNNNEFPTNIDTLRIRANSLSDVVDLFVIDKITSDSLVIRTVGHDRP